MYPAQQHTSLKQWSSGQDKSAGSVRVSRHAHQTAAGSWCPAQQHMKLLQLPWQCHSAGNGLGADTVPANSKWERVFGTILTNGHGSMGVSAQQDDDE